MPDMAVSLPVQAGRNKPNCSTRFGTWFGANILGSVGSKIPQPTRLPLQVWNPPLRRVAFPRAFAIDTAPATATEMPARLSSA